VAQAVLRVQPVQAEQAAAAEAEVQVEQAVPQAQLVQVAHQVAVVQVAQRAVRVEMVHLVVLAQAELAPYPAAQQIMLQDLLAQIHYQLVYYMTMLQMLVLVQLVQLLEDCKFTTHPEIP
jgi:hypothetical protein